MTDNTQHTITPHNTHTTQPNTIQYTQHPTSLLHFTTQHQKQDNTPLGNTNTHPNTLYYTPPSTACLPAPTPQRATKFTLQHNSPHHAAAATTPPPHSTPRSASRVDTQQYTQAHFLPNTPATSLLPHPFPPLTLTFPVPPLPYFSAGV